MPGLRVFAAAALERTLAAAAGSPRRRANLNVHPALDDPIQRMLNVFQPGTYVRPHRHAGARFELFLALVGRAAVFTFDDAGAVAETAAIAPGGAWAVELPGALWHTVVSLAPDTALFEVKPGPFRPLAGDDFAAWAPREGTAEAAALVRRWEEIAGASSTAPRC
ncbi:MAG: WbuC family cupin fold metalloprotein [Thermoanaerobaculaceae bacterium]|nr:WbuC family cupin fold metalloprotein [Thermoanaerobaculaceae bacterium]